MKRPFDILAIPLASVEHVETNGRAVQPFLSTRSMIVGGTLARSVGSFDERVGSLATVGDISAGLRSGPATFGSNPFLGGDG